MKEQGIESGKGFSNFIKANTLSKEEKRNKDLANNLRKKQWDLRTSIQDYEINQINSQEKWNVAYYSLLGLFVLAYPVRFFIMALRWSILTVRKVEE